MIRTGRTIVVELGELPDGPFIPAFQVLDAGFQSGFYSRPLLIPAEPDEVGDLGPGLIVNVLGGENFEIGADGAWAVADFPPAQPGICEPTGPSVCLNEDRFRVEVTFVQGGATDPAKLIKSQDDTGYFWFFDQDNYDLIIKILNGCSVNNHYWVFIGGPAGTDGDTDADVTIEDTNSTDEATYEYRPTNQPYLIDPKAFDTCP